MKSEQATCPRHELGDFNPFDPDLAPRLPELVDELVAAPAAIFHEALGVWIITDPDAAQRMVRNLSTSVQFEAQLVAQRGEAALSEPFNQAWGRVMLNLDGDDHRRVRTCFTRHFTNRRVDGLRPGIRHVAERLADDLAPRRRGDLVGQFLAPLVHETIGMLIGVPASDGSDLLRWTQALHLNEQASAKVDEQGILTSREAHSVLTAYFSTLVAERRARPTDDLLSAMVGECDQGNLSEEELIANSWALYLGGFETTASVAATALVALQDHPDQRDALFEQALVEGPGLEELMRLGLVLLGSVRYVGEDTEVGVTVVPAGSCVYLAWAAHNFHPDRWPDPMEIDVTREPRGHMTFSYGPHVCLGQWLARAAVGIALDVVYRRMPELRVGPLEWASNPNARMVRALPATWAA